MEWVSVKERLPEIEEEVLVVAEYESDHCEYFEDCMCFSTDGSIHYSGECKNGECEKCKHRRERFHLTHEIGIMLESGWDLERYGDETVLYWMPLPEPPKGEKLNE